MTLETLEKDARGMSQNFRSRETSALKTKLSSVRRQWESLCSRAKDHSSALTGSVAHWQMYQNLSQQLMPWIEKAEKYCATEFPKCSSVEEAKDIHELHQVSSHLFCLFSRMISLWYDFIHLMSSSHYKFNIINITILSKS